MQQPLCDDPLFMAIGLFGQHPKFSGFTAAKIELRVALQSAFRHAAKATRALLQFDGTAFAHALVQQELGNTLAVMQELTILSPAPGGQRATQSNAQ